MKPALAAAQRKVRMPEVDSTRTGNAVAIVQLIVLFDRPGFSAVFASTQSKNVLLRSVDRVLVPFLLMVAHCKPNQDFIAPTPDTSIGGPAAESTLFLKHNAMSCRSAGASDFG